MYDMDPTTILAKSYGRRMIDVFQAIDPIKPSWNYICEQEWITPLRFADDVKEIPGARKMLNEPLSNSILDGQ